MYQFDRLPEVKVGDNSKGTLQETSLEFIVFNLLCIVHSTYNISAWDIYVYGEGAAPAILYYYTNFVLDPATLDNSTNKFC